ncbi:hypothetical protein [Kordiimonas gwangyangensis]|uniref:hypothetical protein n=1 Tax=Kordiimonas gwangyangensis TaxID=288022 RepID=UPI000475E29A|nr:hypothetical protein [Kordiimonas gwangyangensis]
MMSSNQQAQAETSHKPSTDATELEEMAKYGILRVSVNYYHFGEFRYTTLKDAIAQAKRAG